MRTGGGLLLDNRDKGGIIAGTSRAATELLEARMCAYVTGAGRCLIQCAMFLYTRRPAGTTSISTDVVTGAQDPGGRASVLSRPSLTGKASACMGCSRGASGRHEASSFTGNKADQPHGGRRRYTWAGSEGRESRGTLQAKWLDAWKAAE